MIIIPLYIYTVLFNLYSIINFSNLAGVEGKNFQLANSSTATTIPIWDTVLSFIE